MRRPTRPARGVESPFERTTPGSRRLPGSRMLPRAARVLLASAAFIPCITGEADNAALSRTLPAVQGEAADILQALSAGQNTAAASVPAAKHEKRSIAKPIDSAPSFNRDVRARRAAVGFGAARARVRRAVLEAKAAAWDEERVGWDSEDKDEADKSLKAAKEFRALVRNVVTSQNITVDGRSARHVAFMQEAGEPAPADRKPSDEFRKTTGMIFEASREVRGAAFDVAHGGIDKDVRHEIQKLEEVSVELVSTIGQVMSWADEHLAEEEVASGAAPNASSGAAQSKNRLAENATEVQDDPLESITNDVATAIRQHAHRRAVQKERAVKRAEKKATAMKKLATTTDELAKTIDQHTRLAKAHQQKLDKTMEEASRAIGEHTRKRALEKATDNAADAIMQHELERARSLKIDEVRRAVAAINQADRKLDVATKGLDDEEISAVIAEVDSAAADLTHIEGHILAKITSDKASPVTTTSAGKSHEVSSPKTSAVNAAAAAQSTAVTVTDKKMPKMVPSKASIAKAVPAKAASASANEDVSRTASAKVAPVVPAAAAQAPNASATPKPAAVPSIPATPPVPRVNATARSPAAPPRLLSNETGAPRLPVPETAKPHGAAAAAVHSDRLVNVSTAKRAANSTVVRKASNATVPKKAANATVPKNVTNATAVKKAASPSKKVTSEDGQQRPKAVVEVPKSVPAMQKERQVVVVEASPHSSHLPGGTAQAKERNREKKERDEQERDQEEAQHQAEEDEKRAEAVRPKQSRKTTERGAASRIVQDRIEELREDAEREKEEHEEEEREQDQVEEEVRAEEERDMEEKEQEEMQLEEEDRDRRARAVRKSLFLQQSSAVA